MYVALQALTLTTGVLFVLGGQNTATRLLSFVYLIAFVFSLGYHY